MIYISSGGFSKMTAKQSISKLNAIGINNIELSGGCYFDDYQSILTRLSTTNNFIVHNYFPVPKKPFVLNLASLNASQFEMSLCHASSAIKLAAALGSPYYSIHAGFLLDVTVTELGKNLSKKKLYPKPQSMSQFITALNYLSEVAYDNSIELLVENNVLSQPNFNQFDQDIFIFSQSDDGVEIMEATPSNVNLLIDVAHLKVSAHSLGFSKTDFLKNISKWIKAYHLSDNNAITDQNKSFDEHSWFWPYLKTGLDYYSLEVYSMSEKLLCSQYQLAKKVLRVS